MTERPDAFDLPHAPSRVTLSPPVFPPGCYRAASRRACTRDRLNGGAAVPPLDGAFHEDLPGSTLISPGAGARHIADRRSPGKVAEALEALARELRRRGSEALQSSPGAPRLEAELRDFTRGFVREPDAER